MLLERNLPPVAPVLRAIGVREIAAYLHGDLSSERARQAGKTATRQYAKRQYTWFNRQPPAQWPRLTEPCDGGAVDDILALMNI